MKKASKSSSKLSSNRRRRRVRRSKKLVSLAIEPRTKLSAKSGRLTRNGGIPLSMTSSQFTAESPLNLYEMQMGSTPGGIRVRGRELIGTLSSSGTTGNVNISFQTWGATFNQLNWMPLGPAQFQRLYAIAATYDSYFLHRVKLTLLSAQPTTAVGQVAFSLNSDYTTPVPPGAGFNEILNNMVSTVGNIYSDMSIEAPGTLANFNRYYLRGEQSASIVDQRMKIQFLFNAVCDAGLTSGTIGKLMVEYDCEFYSPCFVQAADPPLSQTFKNHEGCVTIEGMTYHPSQKSLIPKGHDDEEECKRDSGSTIASVEIPLAIYDKVQHLIADWKDDRSLKAISITSSTDSASVAPKVHTSKA